VLWSLIPVALIAATYGLVFVDASRRAALAAGWFDRPNERVGGPAYRCIPRLGGAGVVVSVLACIIPIAVGAAGFDAGFVTAALIPAAIAGIVGIVDDIRGVPAAVKAFALLGLGIWSWYSGLAIGILPESTPAAISAVVTVCWFVAVPTAVNFVDGLDGLAAGLTVIASAVLSLLGILVGDTTVTIVALTVGAATAGFWWHNRHPARIFMGDGGAMFLGYLLAGLAARTTAGEAGLGIEVAVVLGLMIPLADFASAMLRRFRRRAPFSSDADHIHHLLARQLGHRAAVRFLHRAGLAAAAVGITAAAYEPAIPFVLAGLAACGLVLLLRAEPGAVIARAAQATAVLVVVASAASSATPVEVLALSPQTHRPTASVAPPPAPEGALSPVGEEHLP
jgi:UDP-GlcNAc:undecaprenyl-phosphate GlcNAc-1-phosphate transferase